MKIKVKKLTIKTEIDLGSIKVDGPDLDIQGKEVTFWDKTTITKITPQNRELFYDILIDVQDVLKAVS